LESRIDRQLTFKHCLEGLCGKVRARNFLLRLLAGSTWGAHQGPDKGDGGGQCPVAALFFGGGTFGEKKE